MPKYIPLETLIYDGRDPPWISRTAKQLVTVRHIAQKFYIQNRKDSKLFDQVCTVHLQN